MKDNESIELQYMALEFDTHNPLKMESIWKADVKAKTGAEPIVNLSSPEDRQRQTDYFKFITDYIADGIQHQINEKRIDPSKKGRLTIVAAPEFMFTDVHDPAHSDQAGQPFNADVAAQGKSYMAAKLKNFTGNLLVFPGSVWWWEQYTITKKEEAGAAIAKSLNYRVAMQKVYDHWDKYLSLKKAGRAKESDAEKQTALDLLKEADKVANSIKAEVSSGEVQLAGMLDIAIHNSAPAFFNGTNIHNWNKKNLSQLDGLGTPAKTFGPSSHWDAFVTGQGWSATVLDVGDPSPCFTVNVDGVDVNIGVEVCLDHIVDQGVLAKNVDRVVDVHMLLAAGMPAEYVACRKGGVFLRAEGGAGRGGSRSNCGIRTNAVVPANEPSDAFEWDTGRPTGDLDHRVVIFRPVTITGSTKVAKVTA